MENSFFKSTLLGNEGSYNIFGIDVEFKDELPSELSPPNLDGAGFISRLAFRCISSNVFRLITQSYIHVLVHEMSHALACKILIGQDASVRVFTKLCLGKTDLPSLTRSASDWTQTAIDLAGPMGSIAFSSCKLVAATALKNHLPFPIALTLGSGAALWISGELLYAYVSGSNMDYGDFGCIARREKSHLILANLILVSQCCLGIFAAIKFAA
ncbi:MAG: M50 family metallopeptidase [Chlamydiia bacterium]|nr:M50 family metallopeptidase [Chlamydiia bacterium]